MRNTITIFVTLVLYAMLIAAFTNPLAEAILVLSTTAWLVYLVNEDNKVE